MAVWLSLRPVAEVMGLDHAYWTRHANDRSEVNKQVLNPLRAAIAPVDELSMHTKGVAKAQRNCRCHQEDEQRVDIQSKNTAHQSNQVVSEQP